ncbi:MAG TPA: hypothetical protein VFX23_01780, partial [Limnobacter sp.]|uniref:hypothetical protein n=1 Tax=Limnobacter sp. TaxID=2003368 RepID=UPI002E35633B
MTNTLAQQADQNTPEKTQQGAEAPAATDSQIPQDQNNSGAIATSKNPLQHSVILGLEKSPKLAASTHELEAIMDEANGNFGAMLPTVDLRGQTGRERSNVNNG